MEYLAIIPARGGSKGIKNKNLRLVGSKPLIAWSIEQALSSRRISKVIVSTDCESIQQTAIAFGADAPFLRPESLARDTSPTEPVLTHALDWLKDNSNYVPDAVVLLQPTSPIRLPSSIDNAIKAFEDQKADSLLSVVKSWHFFWKNPASPVSSYDYTNRPRRQDILPNEVNYKENGSIYITKTETLRSLNNRLGGRIAMYEMEQLEEIEIDTELELEIAEKLLESGLKQ